MACDDIDDYIRIDDWIVTGGQPTAEQLESLPAEGFTAVINLAPTDPAGPVADEAALVRSLGMAYHHIPVAWDDPKDFDFEEFERAMLRLPAGRTLIHCVANFRVTAFYSLYAQKHLGWTQDRADGLLAAIWEGSDEPVWQAFIAHMRARIGVGS